MIQIILNITKVLMLDAGIYFVPHGMMLIIDGRLIRLKNCWTYRKTAYKHGELYEPRKKYNQTNGHAGGIIPGRNER